MRHWINKCNPVYLIICHWKSVYALPTYIVNKQIWLWPMDVGSTTYVMHKAAWSACEGSNFICIGNNARQMIINILVHNHNILTALGLVISVWFTPHIYVIGTICRSVVWFFFWQLVSLYCWSSHQAGSGYSWFEWLFQMKQSHINKSYYEENLPLSMLKSTILEPGSFIVHQHLTRQ